ncbi:GSCFA domain-containing protein [Pseudoroseomonas rhizosphaerae]|uniref:GSCFA domain-containing protein n=1 Tax=Teichococcus rhizosphaerae TaxID=1335062 RepID=A0A2C7AFB4_9PROT|nr:GSCFA domain-containing protein [Pseudoroseomonas rhizosphaerae]PHK95367.1 GSCFA domain-containing protein [Pseudoroseomonas rhizosphaerae]
MRNPYLGLPDHAFWSRAVSRPALEGAVDPLAGSPFTIGPRDAVATAGSCFAQHIARHLVAQGFTYLRTEAGAEGPADPHGYDLFSARYGNIYTCRQLLQTFNRAYGLFEPQDDVWQRPDGRFIDAFRPRILEAGHESAAAVREAREPHLRAIRRAFEECDVFVFTLGLTEGWASRLDGAAYPLAPGVAGAGRPAGDYAFHNFTAAEVCADLAEFIDRLRAVNPAVRVILTVSPVPLIATYSARHVLPATIYSKSVLRVAAQEVADAMPGILYFPSFEIITGPQSRGRYYGEDLRSVTPEGVRAVMEVFSRHLLRQAPADGEAAPPAGPFFTPPPEAPVEAAAPLAGPPAQTSAVDYAAEYARNLDIICDEEEIERSLR